MGMILGTGAFPVAADAANVIQAHEKTGDLVRVRVSFLVASAAAVARHYRSSRYVIGNGTDLAGEIGRTSAPDCRGGSVKTYYY